MCRWTVLLIWSVGCGFTAQPVSGTSDSGGKPSMDSGASATVDAAFDAMLAASPDAPACVPGFLDLCAQAPPTINLDVSTGQALNTDSDPRCRTFPQPGGSAVCLIYVSNASIAAAGSLTVTGSRPLAIASTSTITIAGTLDVGSRGTQVGPAADSTACMFAAIPELDPGGAGGGAGGTFTLAGGDGGQGDDDDSRGQDGKALPGRHGTSATITVLRGGCRGQAGGDESTDVGAGNGGSGGHSGGALYLVARQSITIPGTIRATGARGEGGQTQSGGGGGGSGGLVVIEAPTITVAGQISANGGGGGQGGGRVGTTDFTGQPGTDGALGATPATGGFGANNNDVRFSTGGAGGAGTTGATAGTVSIVGGGGGGGAAGVIKLLGTPTLGGSTISPPPSP
ncbi:MAG TPA: hypothetical protein VFK02_29400 [Kofleriaceae bacterium]|nr:hypothetical protein [Kofleriaceae bacterium]